LHRFLKFFYCFRLCWLCSR